MSVIGRLDEQVEAVLIAPLKKERTREEEPRRDESGAAPARPAIDQKPDDSEVDPPLPVWLL